MLLDEKGFTLAELLIAVIIIGIGLSIALYSINVIFSARVDSFARQYNSDLKYLKDQTMTSKDFDYSLEWKDNSGNTFYNLKKGSTIIKEVKINKKIEVSFKKEDSNTFESVDGIVIKFDPSSAVVKEVGSKNGAGTYRFKNITNDKEAEVILIKRTGRID